MFANACAIAYWRVYVAVARAAINDREMWRSSLNTVLCTTILLLTATTTTSDANRQQKPAADSVRGASQGKSPAPVILAHRPMDSWAVTVGGESGNIEYLARKHGLTNRGQVGCIVATAK